MNKIAIIGGGNIGEALIAGLVAAGTNPKHINVCTKHHENAVRLAQTYGVNDYADNTKAVEHTDAVVLAVKPDVVLGVLSEIADTLVDNSEETVVISVAAGVTLKALEDIVSAGTPVVRVMPNTPMRVGRGLSAVAPGRYAGEDEVAAVSAIFSAVGNVVSIKEKDMHTVIALSGSSPAYVFMLAEAMIDAGVQQGLPRDVATRLVTGSIDGAAAMMQHTDTPPSELRWAVCSPGGTTAAAIRVLEEEGLRTAMYRAVAACALKSEQLSTPSQPPR